MTHTASLRLACDADTALLLRDSVAVELADGPVGARIDVTAEPDGLAVAVSAPDVSSLRAALHSVVRLVDAAQRTIS